MVESWRVLDTGLGAPAQNIALNRALLEARDAEEISSTLRFLRFSRSALLGSHQSRAQELDPSECAAQQVPVQRRITSGSAWFVDERQLGWELYLHRRDVGAADMQTISRRVAHAAAAALSALGVDARYRSRDEIEIDGRTVCVTGHAAEGDAVLLQALLWVDVDFERMTRVLRLPCKARGEAAMASARSRIAGLSDVLGHPPDLQLVRRNLAEAFENEFDMELREGDLSLTEQGRFRQALSEIDTAGWIDHIAHPAAGMRTADAVRAVRGGVLRAALKYESSSRTIRQVWFSGDVEFNPRRTRLDLEAALRDVPISRLAKQVDWFFASHAVRTDRAEPGDFVAVVKLAAGQVLAA